MTTVAITDCLKSVRNCCVIGRFVANLCPFTVRLCTDCYLGVLSYGYVGSLPYSLSIHIT